jgi:hypothetical protein
LQQLQHCNKDIFLVILQQFAKIQPDWREVTARLLSAVRSDNTPLQICGGIKNLPIFCASTAFLRLKCSAKGDSSDLQNSQNLQFHPASLFGC